MTAPNGIKQGVVEALKSANVLGQKVGVTAIVDGQYGSTGKGLAASVLAAFAVADPIRLPEYITCNAGPNSGHTSYVDGEKVVLRQLPTVAANLAIMGHPVPTFMNAGAVIDTAVLMDEISKYAVPTLAHPAAAVVTKAAKEIDATLVSTIGSTGKGTGAAIAAKVMREPFAVAGMCPELSDIVGLPPTSMSARQRGVVEVSQGFSLGINSGFYPYCTSRECTVGQALSDAAIHPSFLHETMMVVRTYPIRVAGNSGGWYSDQHETTWEALGQPPELTTVTQKVRRVATFSKHQFKDAVRANRPQHLFLNFCNYLRHDDVVRFVVDNLIIPYLDVMGRLPASILLGFGPKVSDVIEFDGRTR